MKQFVQEAHKICHVCYVILGISVVIAYFYGRLPSESEFSFFCQDIYQALSFSHSTNRGILGVIGEHVNILSGLLLSSIKNWAFASVWSLIQWAISPIALISLIFIILYYLFMLPYKLLDKLLYKKSFLETFFTIGLFGGGACSVVAFLNISVKFEGRLTLIIIFIMSISIFSIIKNSRIKNIIDFIRIFIGVITGIVIFIFIGAIMFPIIIKSLLQSYLWLNCTAMGVGLIECLNHDGNVPHNHNNSRRSYSESSRSSRSTSYGSYMPSSYSSSSYTDSSYSDSSYSDSSYSDSSYSDSSYSSSSYSSSSSSSSEKQSNPGLNLGGYNAPDVGGGSYNQKYGYNSNDSAYGGSYNSKTGYTGPDVGGGTYNSTYGYSSYDSAYGGSYNSTYGYTSSDSYGGSYNSDDKD